MVQGHRAFMSSRESPRQVSLTVARWPSTSSTTRRSTARTTPPHGTPPLAAQLGVRADRVGRIPRGLRVTLVELVAFERRTLLPDRSQVAGLTRDEREHPVRELTGVTPSVGVVRRRDIGEVGPDVFVAQVGRHPAPPV